MKLYDLDELHRQQRRDRAIEGLAALTGLIGSFLLAANGQHAAWGWWAFLASNGAWIAFALRRGLWFMLVQQLGFTATSVLGIYRWVLS